MDALAIITTVLGLIEQVLPIVGGIAGSSGPVGAVIATLIKFEPLIVQAISSAPSVYANVKNIIIALKSDPSTIPAQLKELRALEVRMDAAFDAAAADVDPDAPGAS